MRIVVLHRVVGFAPVVALNVCAILAGVTIDVASKGKGLENKQ